MKKRLSNRKRRHIRVRKKVSGTGERPRLNVFRSSRHIYAQVIDDLVGRTLAQASTMSKGFEGKGGGLDAAKKVGASIAAAAKEAGVDTVIFDRGGYPYHGRVKVLAEAAREGGLVF